MRPGTRARTEQKEWAKKNWVIPFQDLLKLSSHHEESIRLKPEWQPPYLDLSIKKPEPEWQPPRQDMI